MAGCEREPATDAAPPKAADAQQTSATDIRSDPLRQAYFGELHLHTAYSLDAYIFGNERNDPFVAYRFAQGEEVALANGVKRRIRKPLDFAAVTDHAEALGEYELCTNASSAQYNSPVCTGIRGGDLRPFGAVFAGLAKTPANRLVDRGEDGKLCRDAIASPWKRTQQAAAQNYKPGKFTTFVAWEFSANAPEGKFGMMHRNVIFRSDKVPHPFSAFDGTGEDLHTYLEKNCTGDCKVLTIPHNPNYYWGRLYWGKNSDGTEWTQEGLERRERMDRLVEIMQIKGNSECQTGIGTTDEECNFETVFQECKPGQQGGCNNEDIRAHRPQEGPAGGSRARCQPVQARHHRCDRQPQRHTQRHCRGRFRGARGQEPRHARLRLGLKPKPGRSLGLDRFRIPRSSTTPARSPASGPRPIRARRSGTRCSARKPSARSLPARAPRSG